MHYIHTPEESRLKENIWMQQNADYLKKQRKDMKLKKRDCKNQNKKRARQQPITNANQISQISDSTPYIKGEGDYSDDLSQKVIAPGGSVNSDEILSQVTLKKQKTKEKRE